MVDHLKDIVNDSERYHTIFSIPSYIVNSNKMINQESHFMEYYFCVLNTHLKSLNALENKGNFISKFKEICNYLQKANDFFMAQNGYFFRLELILENISKTRIKKQHIEIRLSNVKAIKEGASFFYDVVNYPGDSTMCKLMLWIDESKFLVLNKKLRTMGNNNSVISDKRRRSFSIKRIALVMEKSRARKLSDDFRRSLEDDDLLGKNTPSVLNLTMANNDVVKLKNEYRKKIISQQKEEDELNFDFSHLRIVYVDYKKFNPLSDNFIVRFLSFYIYKQYMVVKKMNYNYSIIFVFLVFQMVRKILLKSP